MIGLVVESWASMLMTTWFLGGGNGLAALFD